MATKPTLTPITGSKLIKDDFEKLNTSDLALKGSIDEVIDEYNAHVTGTSDRHSANSIITDSGGDLQKHIDGDGDYHEALKILFDSVSDPNISAVDVQNAIIQVSNRVSNIIAQSGTSDTEVVDAHVSAILNTTYDLIKDRFEEIERLITIDDSGTRYKIEKTVQDDHLVINFEEVL